MPLIMTKHAFGSRDVLGAQIGDKITIADGTPQTPGQGLYRIYAVDDSTVRFGADVEVATGGEPWPAGQIETRYLQTGESVACSAGL